MIMPEPYDPYDHGRMIMPEPYDHGRGNAGPRPCLSRMIRMIRMIHMIMPEPYDHGRGNAGALPNARGGINVHGATGIGLESIGLLV